MRNLLIPYINQSVLGMGWIVDWKDDTESQIRRVSVSNITLKKADKELRFADQILISKEDHLNFFVSPENMDPSECRKYDCISIAGYINQYYRKDGSIDYGVKQIGQPCLDERLVAVFNRAGLMMKSKALTPQSYSTLCLLRKELDEIEFELENVGNLLPTFCRTYSEYKTELAQIKGCLDCAIKHINSLCCNRSFRRKHGINKNFASPINQQFNLNREFNMSTLVKA